MSSEHSVLFIRFEGPLQSWGETSRWSVRETRREPTKSGVTGLLAACLGWGRTMDRQIAELAGAFHLGVRADRPGDVIQDYQTVSGGVLSAEGKIKINQGSKLPETVVSWRDYLSDACFLVAIQSDDGVADVIEAALRRPIWPPFLGRKSCPPMAPLYPALPDHPSRLHGISLESALETFPWLGRDIPPVTVRAVIELPGGVPPAGIALQRRRDQPLSFAARRFAPRYVKEVRLTLRPDKEATP